MAKSALMAILRRAASIAQKSRETGIPADELLGMLDDRTSNFPISRRGLLHGGLAAAGAVAAATFTREGAFAQQRGRSPILVVGAGIAGLTAAYRLWQGGVRADIIEATNRVGGRIRTLPKVAGTQIYADVGGEFIDTGHTTLISLATELGLQARDLVEAQRGLVKDTFFFQGRRFSLAQIIADFAPLASKINADLGTIGDEFSYQDFTEAAERLDNLSIAEYLDQGNTSAIVRQLLRVAYTTEFGRDPEEQSALNLLFLIGTEADSFQLYGNSDERYQIDGGNSQIINRLADRLSGSIETGTVLEAITLLPDGRYRVNLRSGQSAIDRTYERVLLTLPFSTLRDVRINVPLPQPKLRAIEQLGYGTNSKLVTGYRSRIWRELYRSTASVFTDLGFQNSWESTPFAPTANGLVTDFTGGKQGLAIGAGTPEDQAQRFLNQFERVFPGARNLRTGKAVRAFWPGERFFKGSYSCYLVGQWTQMYGVEGERVGNLYFAGEHTSLENQGYMEGGCETGQRAALEILEDLGLTGSADALNARSASSLNQRRPSRKVPGARNLRNRKPSIR
ncbi:MAG: FAD-dependent oxidoreductase [Microcoleus sp. PH2017_10_PVI_O_A]|uniref:flavin monoamine oxidase family protein n=1 Tax=unclassified Microcoleus TaxID=2642155 RepID=UPI001D3B98B8|nr:MULTISPECIES: NAD(P)/FAD-dependent oxidoreductase [unclassified Microcoleus]TAE86405.1 MAG: FAD-dependent oxidoreductase [Oscillatoriales cyanobacterium]MCC3410034.1 FAD-dependent oxidoreductase [Microcoleus sp. PH2017_10_PVI_O_A]MCC3464286.1 FAD-dependent oxidoreductase [Microcoleus sp. PH2017_11_PCY_U_A]MCC3482646.1 FAD-dependent oxidoreductase [Microcoleus sp. PH2017_12_PCY_D_A]MCC3532484.1 FAD-dependent oxidoreductase [Microcoleus sp. PH2017_21_RUC_O_A]